MYEDLVHSLRICGDSADPIAECCYEDCIQHEHPIDTQCMRALCHKAADAIEQLSNAGSAYGRGWTLGYDAGREENKPRMPLPEPPKEEK